MVRPPAYVMLNAYAMMPPVSSLGSPGVPLLL
jgi:hypothetical protein